jgi:hypothetical protein
MTQEGVSWTWRYEGADGSVIGASSPFPHQSDAETWLGESWRDLLADGVEAVTLLNGDRVVYASMSLRPA